MKKLALCSLLLIVSIPTFGIGTGIGIGIGGGIDVLDQEGTRSETYPQIAGLVDFSFPGMPMGLRAGLEYAWKYYDFSILGEYKTTWMVILLAGQYNVALPETPMNLYLGAGGEMALVGVSGGNGIIGPIDESDSHFGIIVYTGANYNMCKMGIFAEIGFGIVFAKDEESETGNYYHIPIRGGIKFNL